MTPGGLYFGRYDFHVTADHLGADQLLPRCSRRSAASGPCRRLHGNTSAVHVFLPIVTPGLATASLLTFVFAWNEFLFALTFTATDAARTVPVEISLFPGVHEMPWGEIAAAATVVSIPSSFWLLSPNGALSRV